MSKTRAIARLFVAPVGLRGRTWQDAHKQLQLAQPNFSSLSPCSSQASCAQDCPSTFRKLRLHSHESRVVSKTWAVSGCALPGGPATHRVLRQIVPVTVFPTWGGPKNGDSMAEGTVRVTNPQS